MCCDLISAVGDGDGRNEIAAAFQDGGDFTFSFWRYDSGVGGARTLRLLNDDNGNSCSGTFNTDQSVHIAAMTSPSMNTGEFLPPARPAAPKPWSSST